MNSCVFTVNFSFRPIVFIRKELWSCYFSTTFLSPYLKKILNKTMLCRKFLAGMLILPVQLMAIEIFPSYKYNSLPPERRKCRIFVSVNLPFCRGMFFSTTF